MPSYLLFPPELGITFAKRHHDTYPEIDPSPTLSYAGAGASQLALAAHSDLSHACASIKSHCAKLSRPVPVILTLNLDVRDEKSVAAAAAQVEAQFGRHDILYNNAGRIDTFAPVVESDPLAWWAVNEANVLGPYLCTREFLPLLLRGGDKTIVNTASVGAHDVKAGASAHQTSKLAVVRLSEFVVAEYANMGILCYSVHTGGVATDMAEYMTEDFVKSFLNDAVELPANALVYLTQVRRE